MPPSGLRLARQIGSVVLGLVVLRYLFFSPSADSTSSPSVQSLRSSNAHKGIQAHGVIDRLRADKGALDVHRFPFLQSRIGRDDRPDLFDAQIAAGVADYWDRFSKPWITGHETAHLDAQVVRGAIDELLSFNGWVTAACPTLSRPFGQNKRDDHYEDLVEGGRLYYIAIVVHSADHFLVDQLAVIVQLSKRLGYRNLFVSILDVASTDSTPTLADLSEAVLTILGLAFQIRRVPSMTVDPSAAYYPLEEATARNLALGPLFELEQKRGIRFHRVIWLKGFTCPTDVLESLRVSRANEAGLVCGMDWAEHNGFFIFSDRWRTRDIEGNLFRQAKSNAKSEAGPPRDKAGTQKYGLHLPFQTFCCESGSHIVDPLQSYYKGIVYRASEVAQNLSTSTGAAPGNVNGGLGGGGGGQEWNPETQCMDSTQMWFCRDLWTDAARGTLKGQGGAVGRGAFGQQDLGYDDEDDLADQQQQRKKKGKVVAKRGVDDFVEHHQRPQEAKRAPPVVEEDEDEDEDVKAAEGAPAPPPAVVKVKEVAPEPLAAPVGGGGGEDAEVKKDFLKQPAKPKEESNERQEGSDADAMMVDENEDDEDEDESLLDELPAGSSSTGGGSGAGRAGGGGGGGGADFLIPNSAFKPARIVVNPRCVTTYGGVSHAALAQDLFGQAAGEWNRADDDDDDNIERYAITEWQGAPDSFVCQEMRTTGGRVAPKSQRRVGFLLSSEVGLE